MKRNQGSLGKWLIAGLSKGKYWVNELRISWCALIENKKNQANVLGQRVMATSIKKFSLAKFGTL